MSRPASALRSEVLIVDRSEESREVFRTILARRGLATLEAACAKDGLELARRYRPRVVVIDLDDSAQNEAVACAEYQHQCRRDDSALLILGAVPGVAAGLENEQVVSKPYHYGPLISRIEQLCRRSVDAE